MTNNGTENHPGPDQLLQAVQKQEEKVAKGRLKVFLGMAAGVGKTYAMLSAAHELLARGLDVTAGLVETHGRPETEALLQGLEQVPRRIIPYRSVTLTEVDLDAVLARRPGIVLVDEAAHTNAPGSRHAKRWLDILELLDAGIDVHTTLNIQHLESLADPVRDITGITIKETIPDAIIDRADEVILADLPPEELRKRLREGKVYGEERAERAMENFFQPANLSALRELALRLMAERVGHELEGYRQDQNVTAAWKSGYRLMVTVDASPFAETLIRGTRRLASGLNAQWFGAYIETDRPLSEAESRLLSRNLALVNELGGQVVITVDNDPVAGLLRLARDHQVTQLVAGKSRRGFFQHLRQGGSIVARLLRESGNIDVHLISGEPAQPATAPDRGQIRPATFPWRDLLAAAAGPVLLGIIGSLLDPVLGYHAVGLIFLLGVTVLGMFVGRAEALAAALLSGLIWNFFFIPPRFTFAISAPEDLIMFAVFLGVAGVVGQLTTNLSLKQTQLRLREQRLTALYQLTQAIGSAKTLTDMLDQAVIHIASAFDAEVAILVQDPQKGLISPHLGNTLIMDEKEKAAAEWTLVHRRPAGRLTDTMPTAKAIYVPIIASLGAVGVLGLKPRRKLSAAEQQARALLEDPILNLRPRRQRPETPELMALAETFANQLALGLQRGPAPQPEAAP
jgi:two-component system, OmpR family, sensor histidine kinase KdpD